MEFYLNNIYFANGYYGIQAASNGYFNKSVTQLSLSEMAFLCAIPNSPNRYNPLTNRENALKRRDRILLQMLEEGKITNPEYQKALKEKIVLEPKTIEKNNYVDTFVKYSAIKALMEQKGFQFRYTFENKEDRESYDEAYFDMYYACQKALFVSGYRIYTSIDMKKQEELQEAVDHALKNFKEVTEDGIYQLQGAAVCIDNDNGKVVAIVGGRSQEDLSGYTLNRGFQSFRQPGSAIKPLIVYTPSFERGYNPDTEVIDERFEGGPKNSGGNYSGKMKLQRAVEVSKNTVAWKLFEELTPAIGLEYLLKMNFSKISEKDYYPAASLGGFTNGVSPIEMAAAYSALENDGFYREPTCIVKIMDAKGSEIVSGNVRLKQIYQTSAARMMTETLTGVMKNGTARGKGLKYSVSAGKTGTTDDRKDGWFVGYTPYYTTSVWVGYDMPKKVEGLSGGSYPLTIWNQFMNQIHTKSMDKSFSLYDWRALLEVEEEDMEEEEEIPMDEFIEEGYEIEEDIIDPTEEIPEGDDINAEEPEQEDWEEEDSVIEEPITEEETDPIEDNSEEEAPVLEDPAYSPEMEENSTD